MAKGHQHAHGWKTLLGKRKDSAKDKLNYVLLYSFTGKSTSCCKQTHLEQLNSQISLFLYRVNSQMPMAVSHTSLLPSTEGKQRGNSTATSPGSSSSHTLEFHLEQAENFGS